MYPLGPPGIHWCRNWCQSPRTTASLATDGAPRCLQAPRVVADHVVGQILRNDLTTIASEVGLVTARAVDRSGGRKPKRDLDRVTTLAQQIIHLLMQPLPLEGIPKPRHLACRRDYGPHNHPVRFGRRIAEHDEATELVGVRRGEVPLHLSERGVEDDAPPLGCPIELAACPRYLGFGPRCPVHKRLSLGLDLEVLHLS